MNIINSNPSYQPDLVIVGAGPWGSLYAKRVKQIFDKKFGDQKPLSVILLEKRQSPTPRSNTLTLDEATLKNHPDIRPIVNDKREARIADLEQHLRQCAQAAGVEIAYQGVTDPEKLYEQFPSVHLYCGADGANSIVRQKVFGDEVEKTILKRVVQIRYKATNHRPPLKKLKLEIQTFSTKYKTMKMVDRVIEEHVGKDFVTTRFFVSEEEFKAMEAAKSATPSKLNEGCQKWVNSKIHKDIQAYLNIRARKGEVRPAESIVEVTAYPLAITRSKRFVKLTPGKPAWILGGDAAMNFAFWKSFNVACKILPELAALSAEHIALHRKDKMSASPLHKYQQIGDREFWWSSLVTRIINLFLSIWEKFVSISGRVPWQINRWSDQQIREFAASQ